MQRHAKGSGKAVERQRNAGERQAHGSPKASDGASPMVGKPCSRIEYGTMSTSMAKPTGPCAPPHNSTPSHNIPGRACLYELVGWRRVLGERRRFWK